MRTSKVRLVADLETSKSLLVCSVFANIVGGLGIILYYMDAMTRDLEIFMAVAFPAFLLIGAFIAAAHIRTLNRAHVEAPVLTTTCIDP